MGALPSPRATVNRPVLTTGIDFAGPFDIKNYTGRACLITKGYVCVFVSFSTKAVHLEVTSDLSAPAFLAAFKRFVSRRGCLSDVYSDNGTKFVGAARSIKWNFKEVLDSMCTQFSSVSDNPCVRWHFNPPAAPHMGELWEAAVKSFKSHLKKTVGSQRFTFEEFSSILARIEACLNSRPLSPMSENPDILDVLTPGHFLIGSPLLSVSEPQLLEEPTSIINRWQKVKAIHQRFCRRWKAEYLHGMQQRYKWKFPTRDLVVDDLVVIKEDNLPPNEWLLGRVVKLHYGKDQHVRVVDIRTQKGIISRPIVKLVVLPPV